MKISKWLAINAALLGILSLVLLSMPGCTAAQSGAVQTDANKVLTVTTQPIVQAVASDVPYGTMIVAGVGALATVVSIGAGLLKNAQLTGNAKTAIAEIIGDVESWTNPGTAFSDATTSLASTAVGSATVAPAPAATTATAGAAPKTS